MITQIFIFLFHVMYIVNILYICIYVLEGHMVD